VRSLIEVRSSAFGLGFGLMVSDLGLTKALQEFLGHSLALGLTLSGLGFII